ncbi:FAD-dependent oxidoreductase [Paracoccus saliphilus]|uniref:2-polyprenyl-6-methoxyphenol hydroxylase n=1 Tax=Paracoccus saliphilus TaxID=405559 RepID=A0AA45W6C4_9RHOB|nr:NAD(P)/FAD-dependent oxidoreductase [Paracoccus saliphilus]WCR04493.1 FAD-dependent monooxygenase [Paracoccus saliphilus]SIT00657.1 2-polyprenyl-6-methoxyphenol hydroxylase [Paracoccus saliphilus]
MNLNIAIIGAGIGGLAAAALLARDGHRLTLFERFDAPRPLGSGLVIQPVGLNVLDDLGLGEEARRLSSPITRMLGHDARADRLALDVAYPQGDPGRALHRASLFHLLWQLAQKSGIELITSAIVSDLPQDGPRRRVALQDGRDIGPFDLVIDAAGAGSAISPLRARPLGYGALWTSVAWPGGHDLSRDQLRQRYRGARRMAGILPIGQMPDDPTPMAAVFWSLPTRDIPRWRETPLEAWRQEVLSLWPEIEPFLASITSHDQLTPASYSHGTLRRPFAPALAHIGDAAHRASPQLGQGANMALLDAQALAIALRSLPVEDALPAYAAMRRWHVRLYQGLSTTVTPMYQSRLDGLALLRDHILAPVSRLPGIRHGLTRLVAGRLIPPLAGEVPAQSSPPVTATTGAAR